MIELSAAEKSAYSLWADHCAHEAATLYPIFQALQEMYTDFDLRVFLGLMMYCCQKYENDFRALTAEVRGNQPAVLKIPLIEMQEKVDATPPPATTSIIDTSNGLTDVQKLMVVYTTVVPPASAKGESSIGKSPSAIFDIVTRHHLRKTLTFETLVSCVHEAETEGLLHRFQSGNNVLYAPTEGGYSEAARIKKAFATHPWIHEVEHFLGRRYGKRGR